MPTLEPRRIAGVEAVTLRVSPSLELTYAAFDDKLVVSTSPEGVRRLRARREVPARTTRPSPRGCEVSWIGRPR